MRDACFNDTVGHASLTYSNTVIRVVLNALSPSSAKAPNRVPANLDALPQ